MHFKAQREELLKALLWTVGVIERKKSMAVLANILLEVSNNELTLVGTDTETQLSACIELSDAEQAASLTVPARKLVDICRNLPEGCEVDVSCEKSRAIVKAGRSRFTLSTLPADDFPVFEYPVSTVEFSLERAALSRLFEQTQFSIAQQDVRYYLNGLFLELNAKTLTAVATNGHRLAYSAVKIDGLPDLNFSVIVPRKSVQEVIRLLGTDSDNQNERIDMALSNKHIRVVDSSFAFVSKLIDGRFPDYRRVIPDDGDKELLLDRDEFKQVLQRIAILSNEKYHGVRVQLREDILHLSTNNPAQEEAEEFLETSYKGGELDIGFNVNYLIDVMNILPAGNVKLLFGSASSSIIIQSAEQEALGTYVVMPMRV